jgi:hypothetical protein
MTVELDERIRHLLVRIDEMAPEPPLLDGPLVRLVGERPVGSNVRRLLVPVVAAAMVITGVALVAIRRPEPTASQRVTLQSVSVGLPDGWAVIGGAMSTRDPSRPTDRADGVVYATSALPAGPVVVISPSEPSRVDPSLPSSTSTLPDGRRVAVGTSVGANLAADVEIGDGRWVVVEAVGIDEATLLELAGRLVVDDIGARFEGALPDGLSLVSSTFSLFADQPLGYGPSIPTSAWPDGLSITTYGLPEEMPTTWISIFPASVDRDVALAITRHPTPLTDDTFAATEEGRDGVYRIVDGLAVWATSDMLDAAALVALIDGLRPVDDDEWAALAAGGTRVDDGGASGPDTTVGEAPVTTQAPPGGGDEFPASVSVRYDLAPSADGRVATATLPDGTEVRVAMQSTGRLLRASVSSDGVELWTYDFDLNRQPGNAGGASGASGSGDGPYVFAVTDADPARYAELRVVDGRTTYRTDFTDLGDAGVKIAVIVVPARAGRTAEPQVSVIDVDGAVAAP